MSKQATKHHSHGVNAWVNAQGFATWQILFSQIQNNMKIL
jgi:hypothetical protein